MPEIFKTTETWYTLAGTIMFAAAVSGVKSSLKKAARKNLYARKEK